MEKYRIFNVRNTITNNNYLFVHKFLVEKKLPRIFTSKYSVF